MDNQMPDAFQDEDNLYKAVGFIIVSWGFIESAMAIATNAMYLNVVVDKKPGHMPKFVGDQIRFIRHCLYNSPRFKGIKDDALRIIDATEREKCSREFFAHSALTSGKSVNGVYRFTNVEAKVTDHVATEWEFDVRTFPAMHASLSGLADAWFNLSEQLVLIAESS